MHLNLDDLQRFLIIKKGLTINTVRIVVNNVKLLEKFLEENQLSLSSQSVEQYIYAHRQKGLKNNTINTYYTSLSALKSYYIDRGIYTGFFDNFSRLPANSTQI